MDVKEFMKCDLYGSFVLIMIQRFPINTRISFARCVKHRILGKAAAATSRLEGLVRLGRTKAGNPLRRRLSSIGPSKYPSWMECSWLAVEQVLRINFMASYTGNLYSRHIFSTF